MRDYLPSSIRRTSGVVLPSNMGVKWTVHREVGKQPLYYYRGPVREREKREEERERYTFWRPENTTHPTYMLDYYCNKYSPTNWWSSNWILVRSFPAMSGAGRAERTKVRAAEITRLFHHQHYGGRRKSWMRWDSFTTRYSRLLYPKEPLPQVTSGWDSA